MGFGAGAPAQRLQIAIFEMLTADFRLRCAGFRAEGVRLQAGWAFSVLCCAFPSAASGSILRSRPGRAASLQTRSGPSRLSGDRLTRTGSLAREEMTSRSEGRFAQAQPLAKRLSMSFSNSEWSATMICGYAAMPER